MATTAITGKSCTFSYGGKTGTAQITTASIDETAGTDTIQTLGGSVAIAQGAESKVTCDFLYDGNTSGATSFYAALKTAFMAASAGALSIAGGTGTPTPTWTGQAIVTSLSVEMPADGAVTCKAEFTVSGTLPFAGPALAEAETTEQQPAESTQAVA